MTKRARTILIILSVVLLIVFGGLYFIYSFFRAFASPEVTITEKYISSDRGFTNGVTIQKLQVDSMGSENYPVKYTVTYMTTCSIDHPKDRPPNPPKKIKFTEEGKYWWTEEQVNIPFIHKGMTRQTSDSTQRLMWSMGSQRFATCPMKFAKEQWYFITIGDPRTTGIFYYIDRGGRGHQYYIASGVSPI
jgi:hypothetical protein